MRIEIDFIFVHGSKWTLFLCAGRKLRVSRVSMEIDLVFVMAVEIVLMSAWEIVLDLILA